MPGIHRHPGSSGLQYPKNSDCEIHSTSHADCDQRVWTDTQLPQMPSQLIGATIQLRIRQALVPTDDSD